MNDPDPCWSWPHWKFGLKRDDLFTKLHDQYNTFPSAILDPEAFHHDVYEISNDATSSDDFHRRLQDRKEQRLRELNDSLESAAFEIIANPSLIGTEQWQHAVQLFRTKALDSLVRYFASYLPEGHKWRPDSPPISVTSSTTDSLTHSHGSFFGGLDDGPLMTDEPLELSTSFKAALPPSPRSMTMCSESSTSAIAITDHDYDINTLTPPRTLSYSESEPDYQQDSDFDYYEDDASQPCELETTTPYIAPATADEINGDGGAEITVVEASGAEAQPAETTDQIPKSDAIESETPTPKPERATTSFFDTKPSLPHRRHRSQSPSRPVPLTRREAGFDFAQRDPRHAVSMHGASRSGLVGYGAVRRSRRQGEMSSRIRKPSPDAKRLRPRVRRLAAES